MIPESIKKHKPICTEIRLINGTYYVYKITSVWNKEEKRAKKKTLGCIGKITEKDGFIPSKKSLQNATPEVSSVLVKEYGCFKLFTSLNEDILENLKKFFPYRYKEIYVLAILRLLNKATNSNINRYYKASYLSEEFNDLHLSENTVTEFMNDLGTRRTQMSAFMKEFIPEGETLLFDGTNIFTSSKGSSYARYGYNAKGKTTKQINLLYAFAKDTHAPVYYRLLPGNIVDRSAFTSLIKEAGIKNSVVIADKGFYSKKNTSYLDKENIQYILPLCNDTKYVSDDFLSNGDTKKYDNCFVYHDRVVWHKKQSIGADGKFVYIFQDDGTKRSQELLYMQKKESDYEDYSLSNFYEKQKRFGMHFFYSNIDTDAQSIYLYYKGRWEIEECFDYLKNALDLGTVYQRTNEKIEAWAFLNHISLMMLYSIYRKLTDCKLINKYSPEDIIAIARNINRVQINNGDWYTTEVSKTDMKLLETLGIHL